MPRFSILVPPIPAMMPPMTFSSQVLSSSSSSSWARAAPAVITRPTPKATTASRSALDEFRTIQPLVSVFRIVLSCPKFRRGTHRGAAPLLHATLSFEGPYQPGSGRFCGGYPQEGIIQQGRYPGNNRHIRKVKHVPSEGFSSDLDVEQGEIHHRAIGEAVDGVADGAADDQAERHRGNQGAGPGHPDRQNDHRHRLDDHQGDLGELAVVLEPAETDPDIPGQHQIKERGDLHRAAVGDVEHEQQPEFRRLIERQHRQRGDDSGAQMRRQTATPSAFHSRSAFASRGDTSGYSGSLPTEGRIFHDRAHLVPAAFSTTTATPGTSFSRNAPAGASSLLAIAFEVMQTSARSRSNLSLIHISEPT